MIIIIIIFRNKKKKIIYCERITKPRGKRRWLKTCAAEKSVFIYKKNRENVCHEFYNCSVRLSFVLITIV